MQTNPLLNVLYLFIDLILPFFIGYLLRVRGAMSEKTQRRLLEWNIIGLGTLLGAVSLWSTKISSELIWLPVMGMIMQFVPGIFGFFTARLRFRNPLDQGSYVLAAQISNRGIIGMLSVFMLYGEKGYAAAQLTMLLSNVTLYCLYYPMAQWFFQQHAREKGVKTPLAMVFFNRNQLPILGLAIGILLNLKGVPKPESLTPVFQGLVHLSAMLFVIPIGYALDLQEMGRYFWRLIDMAFIKFALTPIAMLLILKAFGFQGDLLHILIILSLSPTAIQAVVTARIHRLNSHLGMAAFSLTTMLYLLVIFPLICIWFYFFNHP